MKYRINSIAASLLLFTLAPQLPAAERGIGDFPFITGASINPAADTLLVRDDGAINPQGRQMTFTELSKIPNLFSQSVHQKTWKYRKDASRNGYTPPKIVLFGDSMIGTARTELRSKIEADYGISSWLMLDGSPGAGATLNTADPSKWLTGEFYDIPLGGMVDFGVDVVYPVLGNVLKIYYIQHSGGGVLKVQSQINSGAWTDEAGFTAVTTAGTEAGKVLTITKSNLLGYRLRIVGMGNGAGGAGTVKVISAGITNSFGYGAQVAFMANSSIPVNNIDNAATVSRAITDPILRDIGANLVIYSTLDGAASVTDQAAFQDKFNAGVRSPDPASVVTHNNAGTFTRVAHGFVTGDAVRLASTGLLSSPFNADTTYYVILLTADTFRLASSPLLAIAGTFLDPTLASSGTMTLSRDVPPSWVIVGPPVGHDATQDLARAAQAVAQKALAATRGDTFFDNRDWAGSPEFAVAEGLLLEGDVHYQALARAHWVPMMFGILGLDNTVNTGISRFNSILFRNSALLEPSQFLGSYRSLQLKGSLKIRNQAGEQNLAYLAFSPNDVIDPAPEEAFAMAYTASGGFTMADNYNVGVGVKNTAGQLTFAQTLANPDWAPGTHLGVAERRWGNLWLYASKVGGGTTGNRSLAAGNNVGNVRFAAGSSTPIVITHAQATTTTSVLCQVNGVDATLKSVTVTLSAGSFTITPNAAATAETQVTWLLLP